MSENKKRTYKLENLFGILLAVLLSLGLTACSTESSYSSDPSQNPDTQSQSQTQAQSGQDSQSDNPDTITISEDGWYNSKDDVALYLHLYAHLPENYITKQEAQDMGWSGGSVEAYAGEGTAIGGDHFGNYEGLLPDDEGRSYQECDIDTVGQNSRGAKRIIFSDDGLIYYTEDHYASFELLYGEE